MLTTFNTGQFIDFTFFYEPTTCDLSQITKFSLYFEGGDADIAGTNLNLTPSLGVGTPGDDDRAFLDDYEWRIAINSSFSNSKTPVLIIPGVLGTDIFKGNEKLWLNLGKNFADYGDDFMNPLQFKQELIPTDLNLNIGNVVNKEIVNTGFGNITVFDYTAALIQEFANQGYTHGTSSADSLFLFPYDWRYSVSGNFDGKTNMDLLKEKIQEIRNQTSSDKVDVIAHSTGGLLLKKYVIDNPNKHNIGKAVFLGVPNTGAPKALKVLLQGDGFGIPWLADGEMKKISQNFPVVYDLAPSNEYYNVKGSFYHFSNWDPDSMRIPETKDLNFKEAFSRLENFFGGNGAAIDNSQTLHSPSFDNFDLRTEGVDLYSIVGCKAGTIGKIYEYQSKSFFGKVQTDFSAPKEIPGDGTVPLESATNLPINPENKFYALKANHGKMPSQDGIRQKIVNILTGSDLEIDGELITQDIAECKLKGKAISIYSPLDIEITDQDGNIAALVAGGVQNEIPNASFDIFGDHKFVYLPDDMGQIYTIKIRGAGEGTFTLKETTIYDNQVQQTQIFSNIPVTTALIGFLNFAQVSSLQLDNNGDGNIDQTIKPSSIINGEQSQDLIPPVSSSTISTLVSPPALAGGEGKVFLINAYDPIIKDKEKQTSGVLNIKYKLDNQGYKTCPPKKPATSIKANVVCELKVGTKGTHVLSFFSTDRAGNNEFEKTINFFVGKNGPISPRSSILKIE